MATEPDEVEAATADSLSEADRIGFYVDLYKQTVETQQHFNDIEWRIRGLALTAATFALGAAGLAAKDQGEIAGVSLAASVAVVGLVLWYAFYFVDRHWYHPLLRASVKHGTLIEKELQKVLPAAGMTQAITEGSTYRPGRIVRILTGGRDKMQSDDKLVWFYAVGAVALLVVAVGLQTAAFFTGDQPDPKREDVVVRIERIPAPHWLQPTQPSPPVGPSISGDKP